MHSNNWNEKPEVKKGNLGERIVHDFLESRGFIVYKPETSGPHGFDRLAVKDKERFIIAEIKSKARMTRYEASGFNVKNYEEYEYVKRKHKIPIYIFFVDEFEEKIYGNWLHVLEEKTTEKDLTENGKIVLRNYPFTMKGEIYFSLHRMNVIADIPKEHVEFLKINSSRNYPYPKNKYFKEEANILR